MDSTEFERITALLEYESDLREKIKDQVNEFDKKTRSMVGLLNKIHSTPTDSIPTLINALHPILNSCKDITNNVAAIVPENQFWRWKDMWSNSMRTAVFAAALIEYLEHRKLLSFAESADILGLKPEWSDKMALPVEDYLHGLISLVNELSRLSVNAVTMGDFEEPIKISLFVKELFTGFSMLNLKNDTLRRRFDSLKYDIKKIEEVVYDVSLRKLAQVPKK